MCTHQNEILINLKMKKRKKNKYLIRILECLIKYILIYFYCIFDLSNFVLTISSSLYNACKAWSTIDVGILSSTHDKASSTAPLLFPPLPDTFASRFKNICCYFLDFDDPPLSIVDALRIVTESNTADSITKDK